MQSKDWIVLSTLLHTLSPMVCKTLSTARLYSTIIGITTTWQQFDESIGVRELISGDSDILTKRLPVYVPFPRMSFYRALNELTDARVILRDREKSSTFFMLNIPALLELAIQIMQDQNTPNPSMVTRFELIRKEALEYFRDIGREVETLKLEDLIGKTPEKTQKRKEKRSKKIESVKIQPQMKVDWQQVWMFMDDYCKTYDEARSYPFWIEGREVFGPQHEQVIYEMMGIFKKWISYEGPGIFDKVKAIVENWKGIKRVLWGLDPETHEGIQLWVIDIYVINRNWNLISELINDPKKELLYSYEYYFSKEILESSRDSRERRGRLYGKYCEIYDQTKTKN